MVYYQSDHVYNIYSTHTYIRLPNLLTIRFLMIDRWKALTWNEFSPRDGSSHCLN